MTGARAFRLPAELDSSHTLPLPLFLSNTKLKAQARCGLGAHSSKYFGATSGPWREGAGHQRGRELPDCWFTPEHWVFPTGRLLSSPPPSCGVAFEGEKQSIPGWPLQRCWQHSVLPHQCLPARVDSEPSSGNQSDHFAHFPSLTGRRAAGSRGGVSPARPQPPLPQR